jgi:hypothetical protein
MTSDLSYPIGKFERPTSYNEADRAKRIATLAALPTALRTAVRGLSEAQLDTPYRPGGWTVRQLVHHVADSHMNGYIRVKLALTEANPVIKPYEEAEWAKLADSQMPIEISLVLLDSLHARLDVILRSLTTAVGDAVPAPGERSAHDRRMGGALRVAQPASHGARHGTAPARRMVNPA